MEPENFRKFKEAWFRGVYERHFPELYFYLRTFTKDEEMIQDVIQDAFVTILEKDKLESVSNIRNYLFSCVRNKLFNSIKSENARERIKTEMRVEPEGVQESQFRRREELIILTEKAVDTLPASCKTIFTMAKIEGLSYRQIAEKLSLSVKTVETQMGIAFRKIREYVSAAITEEAT